MDAELRASLPDQVCGQRFHPRALRIIQETIASLPQARHLTVVREICDRLGWIDAQGRRMELTAKATLERFHQRGWIALPPVRRPGGAMVRAFPLPANFGAPPDTITLPLSELAVSCEPVQNETDMALWRGLIGLHHYLGYAVTFGAQQRYLVRSDQLVLGALGFAAAAAHLKDRDAWIGWQPAARREHRHLIVNNSRFLILPWVRIPNLASHVLAQVARRLPDDFQLRYGYRPLLLETFVEQERFSGGCYRAANWIPVGQTSGRGRADLRSHQEQQLQPPPLPIKSIWLYPLRPVDQVRAQLCGRAA